MKKNSFIQLITMGLLLSLIFMLVSSGIYLYKKHLLNRAYEGDYTLTGDITEIGKGTDNNYIIVNFSNDQKDTLEKLVYDYNSKMTVPPEVEQKKFKSTEFKVGDLVLVGFNNKSKIISSIVYLGESDQILSKVSGKILEMANDSIKIRTIEEIPQELNFNIIGSISVFDNTSGNNQKISFDKIHIYDDIEIDYTTLEKQNNVKIIYLTKKGPNNR